MLAEGDSFALAALAEPILRQLLQFMQQQQQQGGGVVGPQPAAGAEGGGEEGDVGEPAFKAVQR